MTLSSETAHAEEKYHHEAQLVAVGPHVQGTGAIAAGCITSGTVMLGAIRSCIGRAHRGISLCLDLPEHPCESQAMLSPRRKSALSCRVFRGITSPCSLILVHSIIEPQGIEPTAVSARAPCDAGPCRALSHPHYPLCAGETACGWWCPRSQRLHAGGSPDSADR